ncbi:CstA-like transporter-associated (seleno)protein [Streptomyces alboniger]|uniref:CstA-like transporter-associated (seleno)protein n=1 Tax=Streptomyces alboniger TaxID=132473 RepID=UPI000A831C47
MRWIPAAAAGPAEALSRGVTLLRRGLAWLRWYVAELNGEHAYERYAARARDARRPVLPRRAFERERLDRRDRDPLQYDGCC